MTIVEINKKYYTVAERWNELSQNQLLLIMETLFMRKYNGDQGVLKLLKILTGMSYWQFFNAPITSCTKKKGLLGKKTEVTGMEEFFYLTLFLLSERTNLTKQLIPVYDGLYGPADNFDNIVMKELTICDAFYMKWSEDRENIKLLDQLVALLYRPGKRDYDFELNPEGDPRIEFNQNISEFYAEKKICKWPLSVKLAVAYFYDACRWQLVDDNEEVFGSDGSEEVSKYGLVGVMLQVAEKGSLGDFSKVENHYAKTVIIQLDEGIRRAKQQERLSKA